jgi:hypothetical protein
MKNKHIPSVILLIAVMCYAFTYLIAFMLNCETEECWLESMLIFVIILTLTLLGKMGWDCYY